MRAGVLILLLAACGAFAQPLIYSQGIVNAASYQSAGSPSGGIAQGSIFSIFGGGLAQRDAYTQASSFPLDTVLAGVSVRLSHQSGVTLAAIPLFASAGQINAILPSNTPIGLVSVSVTYQGQTSAPAPIKVVRSSFGVFTRTSSGTGTAILQNVVSATELPLNSPANPARPGQTVVLWGTGLGPIPRADEAGPAPGPLSEPLELQLGGRVVPVDYEGRSGCCAGVDQINFKIPADVPTGCAVPISVKLQNGVYSNLTTMAISSDGQPCQDSLNVSGAARRWGEVSLLRTVADAGGSAATDSAGASFATGDPPERFPLPGTCTSAQPSAPNRLDAGPQLALAGPQASRNFVKDASAAYAAAPGPQFLGPGAYQLTGPGGADVGAFTASLTAGSPVNWTATTGNRSQGITVTWTGGDPQNSVALISGPGFLCTAGVAAGSFTIPPAVVANAPAQGPLSVGSLLRSTFTAPGIDQGILTYTASTFRPLPLGAPPLPSSPLILPGGQRILAELAATNAEQEIGLMNRNELAPDRGMLFLFNRSGFYSFWMFQTLIPLDIVWMDQNHRIVFISANTPPCGSSNSSNCPVYGGRELSQYVLEIGSGRAAQLGLKVGDRIDF